MTQLRDFQKEGVNFLIAREHAMLCDDAGLGKSAQVLTAVCQLNLKRILCVGPAVAGVSWPLQVAEWAPGMRFTDLDAASNFGFELAGFYFVSYDVLSMKARRDLADELTRCTPWDLIIIDEGQALKNPGANRTQRVYGDFDDPQFDARLSMGAIANNARRVWVLSGTLTPNHAGEVYTHLRALFPSVLARIFNSTIPDQQTFEDEFCVVRDTTYGRVIEGSKNQRKLRDAVKPHLLRRLKRDVLKDLPAMDWLEAPVLADAKAIERIYVEMMNAAGADYSALISYDEAVDFLNTIPIDATKRRVLGLAKTPGCIRWVRDRLEAGEQKIIVFAYHTEVIDALKAGLLDYAPVVYDGRTAHAERKEVVRRFQDDPSTQVFIGQYMACGTAITLTAAKTELFVEFSRTPGNNYQAASRAHRMGQLDGVQAYFAMVAGTLDEAIARTAARRAREIAELFD